MHLCKSIKYWFWSLRWVSVLVCRISNCHYNNCASSEHDVTNRNIGTWSSHRQPKWKLLNAETSPNFNLTNIYSKIPLLLGHGQYIRSCFRNHWSDYLIKVWFTDHNPQLQPFVGNIDNKKKIFIKFWRDNTEGTTILQMQRTNRSHQKKSFSFSKFSRYLFGTSGCPHTCAAAFDRWPGCSVYHVCCRLSARTEMSILINQTYLNRCWANQ